MPSWWNPSHFATLQTRETTEYWSAAGVDYISLGPVLLRHDAGWINKLPEIIAGSDSLFVSAEIADLSGYVDVGRCHALANVIKRVSTLRPDGFRQSLPGGSGQLPTRFSPSFLWHITRGGSAHFALALEAADLALTAIVTAGSLAEARTNLVTAIEQEGAALSEAAMALAKEHGNQLQWA